MNSENKIRFGSLTSVAFFSLLVVLGISSLSLASHVSCGDILSESTTLDSNLLCPGMALTIDTDNVILDCDGHTINYFLSFSGSGILVSNSSSVTIKNCKVFQGIATSDSSGITFFNSSGCSLIDNTITITGEKNSAVLFNLSDSCTLSRNNIITLGDDSNSVYVLSSNGVTISENTLTTEGTFSYGVSGMNTTNLEIYDNNIMANNEESANILLIETNSTMIRNNNLTTNGFADAVLAAQDDIYSSLIKNTLQISNTGSFGVFASNSSSMVIRSNSINSSADGTSAVSLTSANNATIQQNDLQVLGDLSTGITIVQSNYSAITDNNVSVNGSAIVLEFSSDGMIEGNNLNSPTPDLALMIIQDSDSNMILLNIFSQNDSSTSVDLSSSSNISFYQNTFNRLSLFDSEITLINNSILGTTPKISALNGSLLTLNDSSTGNYWNRPEIPYFVEGVDVDNEQFLDELPLTEPIVEGKAASVYRAPPPAFNLSDIEFEFTTGDLILGMVVLFAILSGWWFVIQRRVQKPRKTTKEESGTQQTRGTTISYPKSAIRKVKEKIGTPLKIRLTKTFGTPTVKKRIKRIKKPKPKPKPKPKKK